MALVRVVPQGSAFWPILVIIFVKDLSLPVYQATLDKLWFLKPYKNSSV